MASKPSELPDPWPPEEEFWDRLQRLRRIRDVSNAQIAAVAGVAYGTVSNWKQGQKPDGEALLNLAEFFGVPPKWLLKGQVPAQPLKIAKEEGQPFQSTTKRRRASGEK